MKKIFAMLVAVVAVVTTSACGSSSDTTPPPPTCTYTSAFMTNVQGTWQQCAPLPSPSTSYAKTSLTVSCLAVTFQNTTYTDALCTAGAGPTVTGTGNLVIGAAVPGTTWVGDPPIPAVTANKLDISVTLPGPTTMAIYTIGYIDTAATPKPLLYVGDFATSDATRPTQLFPVYPLVKQ